MTRLIGRRRSCRLALASVLSAVALLSQAAGADAQALSNTPDPTWQTNAKVSAIVYIGGTVYIAGEFTRVRPAHAVAGSQEVVRNYAAALDVATGNLLPWNPNLNGPVRSMVANKDQSDLLLGGQFSTVGGVTRTHLAAVTAAQGSVTPFKPTTDLVVSALLLSGDGTHLYVGGSFTHVNGVVRNHLAELNLPDGTLVGGWAPDVEYPARPIGATVRSLRLALDGTSLFFGGAFTQVNGVARNAAAKVSLSDATVLSWDPHILVKQNKNQAVVYAIAVSGVHVFLCGDYGFAGLDSHGKPVLSANLDDADPVTGARNPTWINTTDGAINTCAVSPTKLYLGGHFDQAGGANADPLGNPQTGVVRHHVASIGIADGQVTSWNPGADSIHGLYALAITPTKLGTGGQFVHIGNQRTTLQQGFAQFSGDV